MSSQFSVNVRNSSGVTLYGLCVIHICDDQIDRYFLPSLDPGATGPTVTWTTYSGHNDYYYITFGYQATGLGVSIATIMQGTTKCNASSSSKSMFVHVTTSNFYIQYDNWTCDPQNYQQVETVSTSAADEASEAQPSGAPLPGLKSGQFDMVFTNRNSYPVVVYLLHITTRGAATPASFELGQYTTAPPVTCYNFSLAGDLYSMVFIANNKMGIGNASRAWYGTAGEVVLYAPIRSGSYGGFTTQYSGESATDCPFWYGPGHGF